MIFLCLLKIAKRQINDCFWIFFFNNFFVLVEISMILWFKINYCFVFDIDFHVNDLFESNCCKIDVFNFKMRFVDAIDHLLWLLFLDFAFFLFFFLWNSSCSIWNSIKIKKTKNSIKSLSKYSIKYAFDIVNHFSIKNKQNCEMILLNCKFYYVFVIHCKFVRFIVCLSTHWNFLACFRFSIKLNLCELFAQNTSLSRSYSRYEILVRI